MRSPTGRDGPAQAQIHVPLPHLPQGCSRGRCFTGRDHHRMRNQGADTQGIQRVLSKMLNRHWKPFEKFGVSLEQIALDISSYT